VARLQNRVTAKKGVLAAVFDEPKVAAAVAAHVDDELPHAKALKTALAALHGGDDALAAGLLRDVPLAAVQDFARAALDTELRLLADGTAAVAKIAPANGQKAPQDVPFAVKLASTKHASVAYLQAIGAVFPVEESIVAISPELVERWAKVTETTQLRVERRKGALEAIARLAELDPVGFLYLERLDFTPTRYLRGELLYATTLLPGETLRIQHREWSRTERELVSLVSTSTESEQEDSLSEKSELTQSTSTQEAHAIALSAAISAGTNLGVFHVDANAGFNFTDQKTRTEASSTTRHRESTRRASSRAKQEHKVTFRVDNQFETETTNYRELTNATEDAVRWDFHRIVKEWKVELYRYDSRLTYDITIPEPGSYLLRAYREIEDLEAILSSDPPTPPSFSTVTPDRHAQLASMYNVPLDAPPAPQRVGNTRSITLSGARSAGSSTVDVPVPAGYALSASTMAAEVLDSRRDGRITSWAQPRVPENRARIGDGAYVGSYPWTFTYGWQNDPEEGSTLAVTVHGTAVPTPATIAAWRSQAYSVLTDALRARHEAKVEGARAKRDMLLERLGNLDTLTLRQLEREELMKGVLRWMLGPSFNFYPADLPRGMQNRQSDLIGGAEGNGLYLPDSHAVSSRAAWQSTLAHGEIITFLHTAIEWENISFILYPYFWTDPHRWDFKQRLQHADNRHAQFLRAGAARVIVTIRPGFEEAWLRFADTAELGNADMSGTPYVSIADQVRQAAETYRDHEPNPNKPPGVRIAEWVEWTPTGALDVVRGAELQPARREDDA